MTRPTVRATMGRVAACALVALAVVVVMPARGSAQAANPRLADERVLLRTNRGDLVIALYPDVAPRHVKQILKLVRLGVYDSTWFHRIEPSYLVQLSNAQNRRVPLGREQRAAIRKLPAEFSRIPHQPGVVSMAREDADPNSAETSFSILLVPAPHLDGKYTVFGELVWGSDVVAAMAAAPRDGRNRPLDDIVVESALVKSAAQVEEMSAAGQLRRATWPRAGESREAGAPSTAVIAAGIALMMGLSLAGFLLAGRLPPHRVSAFSLLTILVGAFLLLRELAPRARHSAVVAVAIFFGMVALFKLMNRFESTRPGAAPAPGPGPAPAAAAEPDRSRASGSGAGGDGAGRGTTPAEGGQGRQTA